MLSRADKLVITRIKIGDGDEAVGRKQELLPELLQSAHCHRCHRSQKKDEVSLYRPAPPPLEVMILVVFRLLSKFTSI